jgi:hypothetical protein
MKTERWTDPIVDEIHRIREELYEEAGHDFDAFVALIRNEEAKREQENPSQQSATKQE